MIDIIVTPEQTRHLNDVADLWRTYGPILQRKRQLVGGLQWKKVGGNEYLYRYQPDPITKQKRSTSVGRRSPETEALYDAFLASRDQLAADIATIQPRFETQRRVSKALRVNRMHEDNAIVFTTLWEDNLHQHLVAIGDVAVSAYEVEFGRFLDPNTPALRAEAKDIAFVAPEDDDFVEGMLSSLRRLDPSYELIGNAITGDRGPPVRVYGREQIMMTADDHLDDADMGEFEELFDRPPVDAVSISKAGYLVPISALNPLAFAILEMIDGKDEDRAMTVASLAMGEEIASSGPSGLIAAFVDKEMSSPRI